MIRLSPTKCIYCLSIIPEKAKVCPKCTQPQSKHRSFLLYIGSICAIVAALTTAIIHTISIFPDMLSTLNPEPNVKVLQFKSTERIMIANTGQSDIFESHIHYEPQLNKILVESINAMLEDDLPKKEKDRLRRTISGKDIAFGKNRSIGKAVSRGAVLSYDFKSKKKVNYVRRFQEKEWYALLTLALASEKSKGFSATFFSPDDRGYKDLQDKEITELNTFHAHAYISVYSPGLDDTQPLQFNVVGALKYDTTFLDKDNLSKKIKDIFEKQNN